MISEWKDFREQAIQLFKDGYIPVFGFFVPELEEIVVECILGARKLEIKSMTLLINSNGGANDCFTGIKAAMAESKIEFTGLVMSRAKSNGFRLLQHCHIREAVRNAELLFHWGGGGFNNGEISAIMEDQLWPVEHIKTQRYAMAEEVHQRSGVSMKDLFNYALYERSFTAEEALKLNFLDRVRDELPPKMKKVDASSPKDKEPETEEG
jgi:ATP-dependent protease ClpP protease subunit